MVSVESTQMCLSQNLLRNPYVLCLEAKSFEGLYYWQGETALSSLAAPTADKTILC